ncbi:MAG: SLBB domain-containing protein [Thermotogae bacterium]|nr:SLBB domain-containing protein [Thermotogota bacterium]
MKLRWKVFLITILLLIQVIVLSNYRIRKLDLLGIEVFRNSDLTRQVLVDHEGYAIFPLVGRIKVEGLTIDELQLKLTKGLEKYLTNPIVTVYIEEYAPRNVYVSGELNGVVDIGFQGITLSKLFSMLGGLPETADVENIRLKRNGKVRIINLKPLYEKGDYSVDVELEENDEVYIPKMKLNEYIKLFGAVENPGMYKYEDSMTLSQLISRAGGIVKAGGDEKNVYLKRRGKIYILNLAKILLGQQSDPFIYPGDDIFVPLKEEKFVYLLGEVGNPGVYSFTNEEPLTLQTLIAKAGGLTRDVLNMIKEIRVTHSDFTESVYTVDNLLSGQKDVRLHEGDIVYVEVFKPLNVYVIGEAGFLGKMTITPPEEYKLSTVIKNSEIKDEEYIKSVDLIRKGKLIASYSLEDILRGAIDPELENGDTIYFEPYKSVVVYVAGAAQNIGRVMLEPSETPYMSTVVKKAGIPEKELVSSIILMRKDGSVKKYSIDDVLNNRVDVRLENGDTIYFEKATSRSVYFAGDVTATVQFDTSESITLKKALSKLGIENFGFDKIKNIYLKRGNDVETIKLNMLNPEAKDVILKPGDLIYLNIYKPLKVMVTGKVKNPGEVIFDVDEKPSLSNAISKAGGIIDSSQDLYCADSVFLINDGETSEIKVEDVLSGTEDLTLKDGAFVYVKPYQPKYVYVMGKAVENQKVFFEKNEEFDLRNLVSKIKLIDKASQIMLVSPEGTEEIYKWNDIYSGTVNVDLEIGDTIIVNKDLKNYLYILGEVVNPGMYYLEKQPISIVEALSLAGGLSSWASFNKVVVKREDREIELDLSDPTKVADFNVRPGDLIFVPTVQTNKVYVLGAVKNAGIVSITLQTTVLDVIMKSGGFTEKSVTSRVYLFKGGPNSKPIRCNLSGIETGRTISEKNNPLVAPGDVIYVPDNPITDISAILTIISQTLGIINTTTDIIK